MSPARRSAHAAERLATHHRGNHAIARAVQFDHEDSLPSSEQESAIGDIDAGRGAEQQRPAMGVPVDAFVRRDVHGPDARFVVTIRRIGGRSLVEHRFEVREQQRLVLVDDDRGCGVKSLDVDETDENFSCGDEGVETIGDVDELGGTCRGDADERVPPDWHGNGRGLVQASVVEPGLPSSERFHRGSPDMSHFGACRLSRLISTMSECGPEVFTDW